MHKDFQDIKLIACDIDGTLLYNGTIAADRTLQVLSRVKNETDVHITLATGREFYSATKVRKMFDLHEGPLICNNGAVVRDHENVLFSATLPLQLSQDLLDFSTDHNLFLLLFSESKTYYYAFDENKTDLFFSMFNMDSERIKTAFSIFTNANELAAFPVQGFNKACLFSFHSEPEKIKAQLQHVRKQLSDFLQKTGYDQSCYITSSNWNNLEIMPIGVTKATGIQVLADHYQLSLDQIAVFGDNENDIEMLQKVPKSFAMGNAPLLVKDIATYTTDTVENGGVGVALEKYLLNE